MILLIDNYDSFTYNLAQLISEQETVKICRNDESHLLELAEKAKAIVISPGPGTPVETGRVKEIIQRYYQQKPILGICLGHQTIAEVFGSKIVLAKNIRHGKTSMIRQQKSQLFKDLPEMFPVIRYHSLVIDKKTIPNDFTVTATAIDDQEIMAIEHKKYPIFGIQFHPESIGTPNGQSMIKKFLQLTGEDKDGQVI